MIKGFCQVKKNQKIREKLGSGWVGQAPTRIFLFFGHIVFFGVFCVVFMFPLQKNWIRGGSDLTNPSFSRIFFNLTRPLAPYRKHSYYHCLMPLLTKSLCLKCVTDIYKKVIIFVLFLAFPSVLTF